MRVKWSKELVIKTILDRHKKGKPMNYQSVVKDDEKLTGAARRYFGSWDQAMEAAEFKKEDYKNPSTKHENWDRDKIVKQIKIHIKKGKDISPHAVQKYDNKLYASAVYYFGSWEKLIEHLDLDYSEIRKTEEWNEEITIKTIQDAYIEGADLSDATVSVLNPSLYGAAYRCFGGWSEALKAAGINPSKVSRSRGWNQHRIIEIINKAFENGVSLDQLSNLDVLHSRDILRYFSSYEELYDSAGVVPKEFTRKYQSGTPTPNNVQLFREKRKISQTTLGEMVGYSHRWVSLVENHEVGVRMIDAIKLAKALDTTLDKLFSMDIDI